MRVKDAGESKGPTVMEGIGGNPPLKREPTSGGSQAINKCKETE